MTPTKQISEKDRIMNIIMEELWDDWDPMPRKSLFHDNCPIIGCKRCYNQVVKKYGTRVKIENE